MRKVLAASIVVVVVLAVIAGAGFVSGNNVVTAANSVNISKVRVTSVYQDFKKGGLCFKIIATISNPARYTVTIQKMKYYITINGVLAEATGPESVTVPPNSSRNVTILARLGTTGAGANASRNIFLIHQVIVGVGIVGEVPVTWFGVTRYSLVAVELSGNTTQAVGLLGNYKHRLTYIRPDFKIISIKWLVNGHESNEVLEGKTTTLEFTIQALDNLKNYDVMACVAYDIKDFPDIVFKCQVYNVSMKGGEVKTFTLSFAANYPEHFSKFVRGIYAIVGRGSYDSVLKTDVINPVYYSMPDHYPPRLKMIRSSELVSVVGVKWYVNGHEVTEAHNGDHVTAVITIRANKPIHNHGITYCVAADYKYLIDKNVVCKKSVLNLQQNGTTKVSVSFTVQRHMLLQGYFTYIHYQLGGHRYCVEMPNHYPPRLRMK